MIDKSDVEINAIKTVFTDAQIRICFFHVLQAWQRWMRAGKNNVPSTRYARFVPLVHLFLPHCRRLSEILARIRQAHGAGHQQYHLPRCRARVRVSDFFFLSSFLFFKESCLMFLHQTGYHLRSRRLGQRHEVLRGRVGAFLAVLVASFSPRCNR
jgi:hypothetical protein